MSLQDIGLRAEDVGLRACGILENDWRGCREYEDKR